MKVIFIGSVLPEEECGRYKGYSTAGNKMQLGLLSGLKRFLNINDLIVLSYYPIASYPIEKIIFIKKHIFDCEIGRIISIPFINIQFLKILTQQISFFITLLSQVLRLDKRKTVILTYNAFIEISWPAKIISKIFNIPIFCLLADLPLPSIKYRGFKKIFSVFFFYATRLAIKNYAGLIVLNKNAQQFYASNLPYLNIHGGINPGDYESISSNNEIIDLPTKERKILYVGSLIEYNGIETLLNAFHKIESKNLTLHIFGDGPMKTLVEHYSKIDDRIIYNGLMHNKSILLMQRKVDFLINARPINSFISKVTFPSKILEYLMSGTPVLSTRLDCLLNEYGQWLNFIGDDPITMSSDIFSIVNSDYKALKTKAIKAREAIQESKNWNYQAKRVLNFISSSARN
ncbi:MAG: hypothetical protein CVU13_10135 [Bacteroidetes bacterium HGW-Bacteroidetes-8]|jgi:glycosyltransferase involved in cell wall biosynthesis|nr:MAG: hypothetical protein CVU13_10135 [Bacteroidetes bacterium HGW-Bacteroidetes-8]